MEKHRQLLRKLRHRIPDTWAPANGRARPASSSRLCKTIRCRGCCRRPSSRITRTSPPGRLAIRCLRTSLSPWGPNRSAHQGKLPVRAKNSKSSRRDLSRWFCPGLFLPAVLDGGFPEPAPRVHVALNQVIEPFLKIYKIQMSEIKLQRFDPVDLIRFS